MGNRLGAYLVLGCNGLTGDDDFVFCTGVQNIILDLDSKPIDEYNTLINFFDNACSLFDSQVHDYNKCANILSLLYNNYHAYDQKKLTQIQTFIRQHKSCGIWLTLILKEDYKNE